MRILTFTSLFPNSLDPTHAIFVYQRSRSLANRPGNDVQAVSPVPYFPRWLRIQRWEAASALPEQETIGGIEVFHPRYFLLPKISMPLHALFMLLGSFSRVRKLHRRAAFDCIDAHFVYPDGLAAVLLGRFLKIPVVVSARGTDINIFPTYKTIRPMIRWTLRHADALIAVSGALRDSMLELGAAREKIRTIPNGVEPERFRRIEEMEARKKLNLPEIGRVLVAVGSLLPAKGHLLVIQAMAQLGEEFCDLRLYILGEGPYRNQLEKMAAELGVRERVFLPGKRPNEELPLWFSAATLSCLASSREGWPNVVSEALACGTPVIATRVGGIPEIIHSRELGILVEQTPEAFAAGIREAFRKPWNREEIARRSGERTWAKVADEVEEVLRAVTRGKSASGRARE